MWYVYRIYYDTNIVYVGRTNNIENRIRQHVLSNKLINILKISKIEYAELDTEADMNLYELYYILKLKPILNAKDTTKDLLSIVLPELEFKQFYSYMWDTWIQKVEQQNLKNKEKQQHIQITKELLQEKNLNKDILQQQIYILQQS